MRHAVRTAVVLPVLALLGSAFASIASAQTDPTSRPAAETIAAQSQAFSIRVSPAGIASLKHPGDAFGTDYVAAGDAIGALVIRTRSAADGPWQTLHTASLSPQWTTVDASTWQSRYRSGDLEVTNTFKLEPDSPSAGLIWSIGLRNLGGTPITVGDLAITTPFNTQFSMSNVDGGSFGAHQRVLTQRELTHMWVAGNGSFLYLMRVGGVGPYLVMTPTGDTRLEYFDDDVDAINRTTRPTTTMPSTTPTTAAAATQRARRPSSRLLYLLSGATGERLAARLADWQQREQTSVATPPWRQPHTSVTLAAAGSGTDHADFGLKFRFTPKPAAPQTDYDAVRQVLYEENGYDVNLAPGMTVPTDLTATIAIRTKNPIDALDAEYPNQTKVESIAPPPTAPADEHLYRVRFARLGENELIIRSGNKSTVLEFFVTEPIETLIHKRAAFLTSDACRWTGIDKWYNDLITEWDALHQKKRSPDDLDGLRKYIVSCDDPGLGKVPFVASKNAIDPNQAEVTAIDAYITHFVWGGLQQTTEEPHPYGIYGIETWYENRNSTDPGRNGRDHIWRIYDYPHIVLLYYRMYQIAHDFPAIKTALSADQYLDRAFGTAMAYFTVPLTVEGWSAYDTGTYNECIIPDLIDALNDAGRHEQADQLRAHWEEKVKTFVFNRDPYLYGSEYAFDSTTFEGSAALAKWASERMVSPGYQAPPAVPAISVRGRAPTKVDAYPAVTADAAQKFLDHQFQANVADRGWIEPTYYYLGSDYRGGMGRGYLLSYMSQMGGFGVLDYALHHAADPSAYLRLGYASQLSSWALMNTGTPESNYGYWFPGKANDGSAGGGFEPGAFSRAWIGKTTPRGSWAYACEIDLGFNGALRTASTIVTDDPLLGPIAYGGELTAAADGSVAVLPRDGVRRRFHLVRGTQRLHLEFDRDAFAATEPIRVSADGRSVRFVLENRVGGAHPSRLRVGGVEGGAITVDGVQATLAPAPDGSTDVTLQIGEAATTAVEIRISPTTRP